MCVGGAKARGKENESGRVRMSGEQVCRKVKVCDINTGPGVTVTVRYCGGNEVKARSFRVERTSRVVCMQALLKHLRALVCVCSAFVSVYWALVSVYRVLLSEHRALLCVYRALVSVCRALVSASTGLMYVCVGPL